VAGSLWGRGGGIAGLHRLLTEHGEAIRRDLLVAGLRLEWLGTDRLTWLDLRAFITYAPPDAAISRARNPDWQVDLPLVVLREIEHGIRVLAWQKTEDANPKKTPKNYPVRVPITADAIDAAEAARRVREEPAGDAPALADVKKWLGWETNNSK
jgi:hypothetical protein